MSAEHAKTVTDADVVLFAGVTGDFNPVHVDAEAAAHLPEPVRRALLGEDVFMRAYRESIDWMYSNPLAVKYYAETIKQPESLEIGRAHV